MSFFYLATVHAHEVVTDTILIEFLPIFLNLKLNLYDPKPYHILSSILVELNSTAENVILLNNNIIGSIDKIFFIIIKTSKDILCLLGIKYIQYYLYYIFLISISIPVNNFRSFDSGVNFKHLFENLGSATHKVPSFPLKQNE